MLTKITAGRRISGMSQAGGLLTITFDDGSTMKVKVAPTNKDTAGKGGKVAKVRQQGTDLVLDLDGSSPEGTIAEATSSVMLRTRRASWSRRTELWVINLPRKIPLLFSPICHRMRYMSLAERLKALRLDIGISQEAIGSQGFVSTHFWIKMERGLRSPSEELIMRLVSWLLKDGYLSVNTAQALLDELLVLKYLGSPSPFIQKMAVNYAERIAAGTPLLVAEDMAVYRTKTHKRQRPNYD